MEPDNTKKKPAEAGLVELYDVALALVHKRGQLFKLLRANAVCEEGNDVFDATLKRLQYLERVSNEVQLALRDLVGIEDGTGGVEAIGKEKLWALLLHGTSAVRKENAGAVMYGDSEPTPHNPPRRIPRPEGEGSPF